MDLMWRLLTKTFEWQKKLASLPDSFSVRKYLWSEHFHLSSTQDSRLREVAKMDFYKFSVDATILRKLISATRCTCCLLSRFPDLNDLLFTASWELRNFILTMKSPEEMHSFVECSVQVNYMSMYVTVPMTDLLGWFFSNVCLCIFNFYKFFFWGHSIWGL